MSPGTIEALNDCEKASKEILKPLSLIGHAINKNGYLNKTFRKNQKTLIRHSVLYRKNTASGHKFISL